MKKRQIQKRRASKSDWLSVALELLASDGVAGVQVQKMARKLGIAKSGFYWHFRDRDDLLQQLLDYWSQEFTAVVTANPTLREGDPAKRLLQAMNMILEYDLAKYEIAIRAWAETDPAVAAKVQEVYQQRFDFVASVLADVGFKGQELTVRTRLFLCYHTWAPVMFRQDSKSKRRRLSKHLLAVFLR